ncbi:MAG: type II toxin-antitoxin system VapC family toxin [Chloroflexaceae bacterium]|jgi:tRNA(fMet)-specific endonuclease VapC
MIYLLDTNTCIEILNGRPAVVRNRFAATPPGEIGLCSIVKAELYHGASRSSQRQSNMALLQQFFSQFRSLAFDDLAAEIYGDIRADLQAQGMLIGPLDMLIAAIALANQVKLVTHNVREFSRVRGLDIEDWHIIP